MPIIRYAKSLPMGIAFAVLAAHCAQAQAQDIGIPACDKLLKVYETCVIPKAGAAEGQMKQAFAQMRGNWQSVAQTAEGKKNLEPVCNQTSAQLKTQLASFNCSW